MGHDIPTMCCDLQTPQQLKFYKTSLQVYGGDVLTNSNFALQHKIDITIFYCPHSMVFANMIKSKFKVCH